MNPFVLMQQHQASFTANDQLIYEAIMRDPTQVPHMTTSRMAAACGVSQPALSRFIKSLGYSRYQEFRNDITAALARSEDAAAARTPQLPFFSGLYERLAEAEQVLDEDTLRRAAALVRGAQHLFCAGEGLGAPAASLLRLQLQNLRLPVYLFSPEEAGQVHPLLQGRDLCLLFSPDPDADLVRQLRRSPARILLLTNTESRSESRPGDLTITLQAREDASLAADRAAFLYPVFVQLLVSFLQE